MKRCDYCALELGPDDTKVIVVDVIHETEDIYHLTCAKKAITKTLERWAPENGPQLLEDVFK